MPTDKFEDDLNELRDLGDRTIDAMKTVVDRWKADLAGQVEQLIEEHLAPMTTGAGPAMPEEVGTDGADHA